MKMRKHLLLTCGLVAFAAMFTACSDDDDKPDKPDVEEKTVTIDFESAVLGTMGYNNQLKFTADGASFNNNYNADYDSWDGFSYSCLGSDNFVSFTPDQYDVYNPTGKVNTGAGHDSNKFAIGYGSEYFGWPMITFDAPVKVKSFYLNNTSYVYNTIKKSDAFAKKFGKGDWFLLTIDGYAEDFDADAEVKPEPVYSKEFYLADYRNDLEAYWYIVSSWTLCDVFVNSDPAVKKLVFRMTSTDNGAYGMNTPSYFALDDLKFEVQE